MVHLKRVAALCALALALSGCIPSAPSASSWRESTSKAVGDVVSEVATAQLTLQHEQKDSYVGRYPVVVLVYSEEAAAKAADKVTRKQPPPAERDRYAEVSTQLGAAVDLITRARVTLVAGQRSKYDALIDELRKTAAELTRVENQLKSPAGGER